MDKAVTIVVPVYADWPSLKHCLDSLQKYVDRTKHKVILVNDCGPEAEELEKNIKAQISGKKGFEYFRNPENIGFLKTCNRAVTELDKSGNDIMLLNSDTKATAGFLDEMLAVLYESAKNGAVSPRSNNATICTIPLAAAAQKGIDSAQSYEMFKKIKSKLPRSSVVPVAHGFCMLIKRPVIVKFGLFDEIFGKGYGEEVDFCLRIKKSGYQSLISNRSFVYHLEAKSFTHETKARLIEEHNKIVWERWPTYRQDVRDYMERAIGEENRILVATGIKLPTQTRIKSTVKKLFFR